MIYRNGKCYNNNGTEMSLSQINQMAKASYEYIKQISCPMAVKLEVSKELSKEDIVNKFKDSNFTVK